MPAGKKITFTIRRSGRIAETGAGDRLREALACLQRGELAEARRIAQAILEVQPRNFDALHLLGLVAIQYRQPAQAIGCFSKALAVRSDAHALANRASAHNLLRQYPAALADSDAALRLQPVSTAALCARGHALNGLRRQKEALACFTEATTLDAACIEAWQQRGNTLLKLGEPVQALDCYSHVLAIEPAHGDALTNRGVALSALRRHAEALDSYEQAIALRPGNAGAYANRGIALSELGRHREALASFERAIAIRPDYVEAHANEGVCRLLTGNFERGWPAYEWRWPQRAAEFVPAPGSAKALLTPQNFGKPLWDGAKTPGRVLVWPEQGIGDQILFASMLADAQQRARLVLALEPRLHPLFRRSFPKCELAVLADARKAGDFEAQIPLGGLGALFRRSAEDFPGPPKAYLKADARRSAALRRSFGLAPRERLCGISWASRQARHGQDKSMALADLLPLFALPGLRFVDLQYGDTAAERSAFNRLAGIDIAHVDAIDNRDDIDGLAALINACDVIVTISNTTAHIAGALGKDVLLMLPASTGRFWYWQAERDDTLWYPKVRVFRQDTAGDWRKTVGAVCAALAAPAAPIPSPRRKAARKKQSAP
jgi:tetratricopeptide (TPR) repeat protein